MVGGVRSSVRISRDKLQCNVLVSRQDKVSSIQKKKAVAHGYMVGGGGA